MALLVSSLPLSLTTIFGLPRSIISRSSSRATRGAGERGVGYQRQALACAVIDDGEDAEATAVGELVRYEVERPAVVGRHRNQHRRPGPDRALAPATAAHRKLFFPVEPEQLLVVDHVTFPLEQDMQAPIAEAAAFMGDRLHALAKAGIVRPGRLVSHGHAAAADGFTRPPFAHPVGIHETRDSFPLGRGRHHFFPKRSFNAALSSMASASSRFSRVFSSSSVFSRLASEPSIPPNVAFHL